MKRNITINLCGRLFQIDEDAYELLQQYIESLRSSFGREEGGDEIVDDIEARIAELFDELRQQGIEAITIDHVKDIVTRIGRPEELAGENENDNHNDNRGHRYDSFRSAAQDVMDNVRARTAGKRLYRNPKDKMLTGVCSGIAAYTNTDPVLWRLLFVLLVVVYGVGIISYIILSIVLPEASTPNQMLQMEGRDVTPQNLADAVVEEDERPAEPRRSLLGSLFTVVLKLLAGLFLGILAIVALVLLVCFLLAVGTLIIVFTVPGASHYSLPFDLGYMNLPEIYATHPWLVVIFCVSLLLSLSLPVYAIIHILLEKAGKLRPMGIAQRILCILIWIVAMFTVFPTIFALQDLRSKHWTEHHEKPWSFELNGVSMTQPDFDFFTENDWVMVNHDNTDDYYCSLSAAGEYYTGNPNTRYLDGHVGQKQQLVYQAEHTEWVEPGVYSLSCVVRADGWGAFVYTVCNGEKQLQDIPARGFKGGELWQSATDSLTSKKGAKGLAQRQQHKWHNIAKANHSRGYGWSRVQIDNIVVAHDSIPVVYGVSTVSEFTGHPCHAKQFSAADFVLTRTGDLPGTVKK
jgi:phage shock protein PspC (stress-responsive transcriptional regulator)